MSRAANRSKRQGQRLASSKGGRWLRKNRLDAATAASILLSVLVGLVGNLVVGRWSWASLATLMVLAISLAGLEVLRHRLGNQAAPPAPLNGSASSSRVAVAVDNPGGIAGDWVVAGGDVYQIQRQITIGSGAVLLLALVVAGAILVAGRVATQSDDPSTVTPELTPRSSTPAQVPEAYSRSTLLLSSQDFDTPKATSSLADASYNDDSGLSMLNSAGVAPAPAGQLLSAQACRALPADAWTSSIAMASLHPGLQLCLHTSDDRWGTLAVTRVKSDALGGFLGVTWTVWL